MCAAASYISIDAYQMEVSAVRLATLTVTGFAALVVGLMTSTATAAPSYQGAGTAPATRHVQEYAISIGHSLHPALESRVEGPDFAIAPLSPVRITFTNDTADFRTFTIRGLGVTALIPPARPGIPSKTTLAFTARTAYGVYAWTCVSCKSGAHGPQHLMSGHIYAIINPRTLAA